jgi:hypothetical protein
MAEEQEQQKEISAEELLKINNELDNKLVKVADYSLFYNTAEIDSNDGSATGRRTRLSF